MCLVVFENCMGVSGCVREFSGNCLGMSGNVRELSGSVWESLGVFGNCLGVSGTV